MRVAIKKNSITQTGSKPKLPKANKLPTLAWSFLLVGGLAQMLPVQMAPIMKLSVWGISLQTTLGVLSVILALYFLLGEDE